MWATKRIYALICLLIGLVLPPSGVRSQEAASSDAARDSLIALLPSLPKDTVKVAALERLARIYMEKDPAKAEKHALEALALSKKINNAVWKAKSQELIAQIYKAQFKHAKATIVYAQLSGYYEKTGQKLKQAEMYSQLGNAYTHLGLLNSALDYELKALKIAEEIKNNRLIGSVSNSLGMIYSGLGEEIKTIGYYNRFAKISAENKDDAALSIAYNNLSDAYMQIGFYGKAIEFARKSMSLNLERKSSEQLISNYATLSEAYENMRQMDSSFYYVKLCFDLSLKDGDLYTKAYAYNDMARVLIGLGDPQKAVDNLKEAEKIDKTAKSAELQQHIFLNFSKAYALLSNHKEALHYQTRLMNYKDSLFTTKMSAALAQAQTAYDTDKKQKEIAFLMAEKQVQAKTQKTIIGASAAIILSVLVVAAILYRNKKKEERQNYLLAKQSDEITQQRDDLKIQHDEIEKAYSNINTLSEIGRAITSTLDMSGLIRTVYENVNKLMDAAAFGIGIHNPKTMALDFNGFVETGDTIPDNSDSLLDKSQLSVWCFENGKEVFINDFEKERDKYVIGHSERFFDKRPESLLYLPLINKDKKIGVITVQSFSKFAYSERDLTVLRTLASYIVIALENAENHGKSEKLLLNILPAEVAEELKKSESVPPRYYDRATVLFTDFKGFTKISEKISPQEVMELLNHCFQAFDAICEKHGLEKIKTIGDSYMCVGGVPRPNTTNAYDCVAAALEMQAFISSWKLERESAGLPAWELRLGIHTGDLIAGVIGTKKFAYDVWGDTVNTASRMESAGEAGQVNISEATYQFVQSSFDCRFRGKISVKGKGEVGMYFVMPLL